MLGATDLEIRTAVFDWLTRLRDQRGDATVSRDELANFEHKGTRIPLVGPSGIWKPAACDLPISISTIAGGPYEDSVDEATGLLTYAYRGTDPSHRDNRGLRTLMRDHVPLVYFVAVTPGRYLAQYPVFIIADRPDSLMFTVEVETKWAGLEPSLEDGWIADTDARRVYAMRVVRHRLHQVAFRERVIRAYQERCALCQLRHLELLDAAHIVPDSSDEGDPVVSNGIALCKLHHAAFDRMFFAIRPDYVVEVRPSILTEVDGPMLIVGLQQIHERPIFLPRHRASRPDPERLERRYQEFRQAS
jgi:putative restriction endonuclease